MVRQSYDFLSAFNCKENLEKLLTSKLGGVILLTQGDAIMNREEILEKSRRENKGTDEMELIVLNSAGKLAAQIGMLICCVVAVLQVSFTDSMSYESWMIYFSILGTLFTVKYVKLHKKHELLLAILFSALFVFFTVLFVHRLVG